MLSASTADYKVVGQFKLKVRSKRFRILKGFKSIAVGERCVTPTEEVRKDS